MKVKILSLLLSVTLIFFSIVPARAAETDFGFVNILDYCMPNDSGDLYVYLDTSITDISFSNPMTIFGYNVDILLHITGEIPSAVSIVSGTSGSEEQLEIFDLGNHIYRVLGLNGHSMSDFILRFQHSSPTTIEFLSFRVETTSATFFDETGVAKLETYGYSATINYNSSDTVNGRTWTGVSDYTDNWVTVDAYITDWKLYDRLDFQFTMSVSDINSVTAFIGDQVLPCYISFVGSPTWVINDYVISVSIDLTGVDKSTTLYPTVHIEASAAPDETNQVSVFSMSGVINVADVDPVPYWLQRIYSQLGNIKTWIQTQTNSIVAQFNNLNTWIDDQTSALIDAIKGDDTTADEEFNSQAAEKNEALQEMVGVMDTVQRPYIDSLDPADTILSSGADISGGIGPVLTVTMKNPIVLQVLVLSLTFALTAYVLYGKR